MLGVGAGSLASCEATIASATATAEMRPRLCAPTMRMPAAPIRPAAETPRYVQDVLSPKTTDALAGQY
jgi:hypothetical protein